MKALALILFDLEPSKVCVHTFQELKLALAGAPWVGIHHIYFPWIPLSRNFSHVAHESKVVQNNILHHSKSRYN